jgi:hypothetical protein
LQGYVIGIGLVPRHAAGWVVRLLLIAGGVLLAAPVPRLTGLPFAANLSLGAGIVVLGLGLLFAIVKKTEQGRTSP